MSPSRGSIAIIALTIATVALARVIQPNTPAMVIVAIPIFGLVHLIGGFINRCRECDDWFSMKSTGAESGDMYETRCSRCGWIQWRKDGDSE